MSVQIHVLSVNTVNCTTDGCRVLHSLLLLPALGRVVSWPFLGNLTSVLVLKQFKCSYIYFHLSWLAKLMHMANPKFCIWHTLKRNLRFCMMPFLSCPANCHAVGALVYPLRGYLSVYLLQFWRCLGKEHRISCFFFIRHNLSFCICPIVLICGCTVLTNVTFVRQHFTFSFWILVSLTKISSGMCTSDTLKLG